MRAAGEFREGDTVRRIERDGRSSSAAGDLTVILASDTSVVLSGYDLYRKPARMFTDSVRWSSGEPKYELIKSIEAKVAEELMA